MLSLPLMGKIDRRLRQAKNPEEILRGCNTILIGDNAQLQPVAATPLFASAKPGDPLAIQGEIAYSSFEKVITLTEIKRQVVAEGDTNQKRFIVALNNIREGQSTVEDWRFFQSRTPNIPDFTAEFQDATRLFATNDKVNSYNNRKLQELNTPITLLLAKHKEKTARRLPSDKFRGLQRRLHLARSARIIIVSNIQPQTGLLNGTLGTIEDIARVNSE